MDVFDVILAPQLEILDRGSVIRHQVIDGVGVVEVVRQRYLLRGQPATQLIPLLQQHYLLPRLAQIAGSCQPVRATPDNYYIVIFCHFSSFIGYVFIQVQLRCTSSIMSSGTHPAFCFW